MANIKHYLIIKAPAEKVYEAITSQQGLRDWWTTGTDAKPKIGYINHFKFGKEYFNKMKIVNLESPNEVLWECIDGDKEWLGTNISFELIKNDESTTLRFSHTNWADETDFFASCTYHWGRYMESLKLLCETGKGTPYKE